MKYILLFCIILFALPAFGQQDSIVYSKGVRSNKDSVWFKEIFTKTGDSIEYKKYPWTKFDSITLGNILNDRYDAANQYLQAKQKWDDDEKAYKMRIRQSNKQLVDIFKKNPDGPNRDTIKGEWKLNGVTVTIRNDRIGNKRITWYSQDVFEYEKEIFFRRGKRWVSDKSILSK